MTGLRRIEPSAQAAVAAQVEKVLKVGDSSAAIREGTPGDEPSTMRRLRGRALVVADAASAQTLSQPLEHAELDSMRVADAYAAMVELVRRPLAFRAIVLSLAGLYPEEMELVEAVKRRFGHIEVVLAHSEGREAGLAEGVRLGADGLIVGQRIHRISTRGLESGQGSSAGGPPIAVASGVSGAAASAGDDDGVAWRESGDAAGAAEPVLTPEELRALLQDE